MVAKIVGGEVEIDHCPKCSGLWFDPGELQQGVATGGEEAIRTMSAEHKANAQVGGVRDWKTEWLDEEEGECPRCRLALRRTSAKGKKDLFLDICPGCEGVWYDGGEVNEFLDFRKQGLFRKLFR